MTNSLTMKLSNMLFNPIRNWVEVSNGNWNKLIGGGFLLLLVGIFLLYIFTKRMGRDDEKTELINLKSAYIMLLVIVLLDLLFPKDYMWQIFFLFKYSLAFITSGIYLAIQYKKDFE